MRRGGTEEGECEECLHHAIADKDFAKVVWLTLLLLWRAEGQRVVLILLAGVREWPNLRKQRRDQSSDASKRKNELMGGNAMAGVAVGSAEAWVFAKVRAVVERIR